MNYLNLFSSLKSDCEEYTNNGICKPNIIVVSGDLIEGARGDNANEEIEKQYAEVEQFLNELSTYFLDGDKSKMVIVPGNHDLNREISSCSMRKSDFAPKDDYSDFKRGNNEIKWSWNDFNFYRIVDPDLYCTRFQQFFDFYNRFFSGIRSYPVDIERSGFCVDFVEYNISFACFNSCHKLDHLNPAGCICPDAISEMHDELTRLDKNGRLIVGVWHHHISGLPCENNYMDKRILDEMMVKHIKIGLFGHQHVSGVVNEYKELTSQNKIILISSGSLYGSNMHLPSGVSRQYNVLDVCMEDCKAKITIHVRKDCSQYCYDIPVWRAGNIGYSSMTDISFDINLSQFDISYNISKIDEETQLTKDYKKACMALKNIGFDNLIASKCFDSYIKYIDDYRFIIDCIKDPRSVSQCLAVLEAAIELRNKNILITVLGYKFVENCTVSFVQEQKDKANELIKRL
jgi:hypothetical protein